MYMQRKTQASSSLNRWIRGEGAIFGIISLSALLSCFIFGALVLTVRNWGWWRIRDFERRRRYIKTWHGWTDKEKHEKRHRFYQERRDGLRDKFRWKTTSANMTWVFWDLNGSKQKLYMKLRQTKMLNWLPRWMRSWPPGASKPDFPFDVQQETRNRRSRSHSQDIELGTIQNLSHRRRTDFQAGAIAQVDGPPSEIHTVRSVRFMTETIPDSSEEQIAGSGTVRRRRDDTIDSTAWHANSSETSRATVTQFFMPAHGFRTPIWAENLFGQHNPGKPNMTPSKHQLSATVTLAPSDQDHTLFPGRNTLRQESIAARRAVQSSPTPVHPLPASALLRSSTVLSNSIEFESLFTYIDRGSRYGRFGTTNPPRRLVDLDSIKSINIPEYSQSLTQRSKKPRRPSIVNLFPSLRRHLSRARKAPTAHAAAHGVRSTTSSLSIRLESPLQDYAHGVSPNDPISKPINLESPMVSPAVSSHEPESIQLVGGLSPVPTRSLDTLHPTKTRLSELSFSPPTPDLQTVSGDNASGIPSLSLPDPRHVSTTSLSPEIGQPELAPSRDIPQEINRRFDWLDVGSQYLSPTPSHRHGPQRSLDESALRRTEPSRVLRRVGNLQNRSLGNGGAVRAEKESSGAGVRIEGKENEQFWAVGGGDVG